LITASRTSETISALQKVTSYTLFQNARLLAYRPKSAQAEPLNAMRLVDLLR
jgi:hypothetical protein